jgi:hypothetical protein
MEERLEDRVNFRQVPADDVVAVLLSAPSHSFAQEIAPSSLCLFLGGGIVPRPLMRRQIRQLRCWPGRAEGHCGSGED